MAVPGGSAAAMTGSSSPTICTARCCPRSLRRWREGGVLLYATFMTGQERFGRPTNPDFLLRPGELLAAFMHRLAIVAFEQGEVRTPTPAMVQRIAAVKGEVGQLPP